LHNIQNETGDLTAREIEQIQAGVVEALRSVYDPEIPVDIYELGLIYRINVATSGFVTVDMTLTSPGCPVAGSLPGEVESRVRGVPGVRDVQVELVWDPPWSMEKMSDAAKLELGFL
jgi:FeS assembly SUF system protein